jgi:hypothetical protein
MTFYPTQLSESHEYALTVESAILPEIATERGYQTIRSRAELLDFKKYQRRPGLLIPVRSPSGATCRRLRPDHPRKGKDGKPRKYEQPANTPNMLDVHPRNVASLGDADMDLWVTEGEKKADSLTSRGLCTVALFGVWGYCVTGTKGRELLPCWKHIELSGRRVYVVFDADVMVKENVQAALERLVSALEDRGAKVLVVYLPGPEKGVDDYLATGHTVNELKMLARRFDLQDIGRIRLSRDEKLRALVEDLDRTFWNHEWRGMGGHSGRDVYKVLVDTAKKSGKSYAEGLRVTIARRTLAMRAKVSTRTLRKAIARLEDAGLLYRDLGDREADKAGAFVLRADVPQVGERGAQGEEIPRTSKVYDPCGVHLRAPRLRWSDPGGKARAGVVKGTVQVRQARMESRPAISRLGKIRGAILDALDAAGGAATLKEIADTLHKKRPRDIRRRSLPMLEEAGIITVHDDMVSLTCNWLEALDNARKLAREIDGDAGVDGSREKGAETLDRERYARERVAYRDPGRDKQDPAPAEGETRERREDYPRRRREAIERAITRLFTDNPEFRDRRAGQIVCALVMRYIGPDFPRGPDGMPKDSEVEEILSGVAA